MKSKTGFSAQAFESLIEDADIYLCRCSERVDLGEWSFELEGDLEELAHIVEKMRAELSKKALVRGTR